MASLPKRICRAVKKHPILYDRTAEVDDKTEEVDEAWEAVAYECNETVSAVKLQWNDIKKALVQNLQKSQRNQTRKTRSRDSYLNDELKFLLPHVKGETINSTDDFNDSDASVAKSTTTSISSPASTTPTQSSTAKVAAAAATPSPTTMQKSTSNDNLNNSGNFSLSNLMRSTKDIKIGTFNDKRKRELSKSLMNSTTIGAMDDCNIKPRQSNVGTYIIAESSTDNSSAIRFRRIVEDPVERKEKEKARKAAAIESATATAAATAAAAKLQGTAAINEKSQKNSNVNKLLRTRSHSLYVERPIDDDDDDSEDKPPPAKKLATTNLESKETITSRKTRVKTRVIAGNSTTGKNAVVKSSPATPKTPTKPITPINRTTKSVQSKDPLEINNYSNSYKKAKNILSSIELSSDTEVINDADNVDNADHIDMNLLAAAAAAEAAAAKEETKSTYGIDNSTQCEYQADEEDNEFIERMRKWLQNMNSRQKIIFRKGVLQAYLDVFDDPRHFEIPKGYDKCLTSQQNILPTVFNGMSPVELRLVRHLAITVAGHKLTAETNCVSPSSFKLVNNVTQNDEHPELATTPPTLAAQNSLMRSQLTEKPPSIIRTTAIALSNHARTASGMQRVLRKVVRVNNGTGDNIGVRQPNGSVGGNGGSGGSGNTNNSPGLIRSRSNVNSTNSGTLGISQAEKQRIYRILPNGTIKRHITGGPGSRLNNNNNNNNNSGSNSPSSNIQFLMPNSSKNATNASSSTPPITTTTAAALPTTNNRSPSNGGGNGNGSGNGITSTMTTSTGTVITTRNINPKSNSGITQTLVDPKTGILIRRHLPGNNNSNDNITTPSRATISRRYSICSSAPPRELQQSPIIEKTSAQLWQSLDEPQQQPKLPTLNNRIKINEQQQKEIIPPPKPTVRVRYAQNHGTPVTVTNLPRINNNNNNNIGDNQFLLPSPPKQNLIWKELSPANLLKNQQFMQHQQQQQQRQQQNSQLQHFLNSTSTSDDEQSLITNPIDNDNEFQQDHSNANRSNCLITSDDFQNFIVKNEPLDIETEDV